MNAVVIDTNVPIVANENDGDDASACAKACRRALEQATNAIICIDDRHRIIDEYIRQVGLIGTPGIGHAFVKRVHQMQAVPNVCEMVEIHPSNAVNEKENYDEFPDDPDLDGFDASDRKFVAVALASQHGPPVLNATDSDWWNDREALERNGVKIEFLCPEAFS
ncbi:hypothetical protein SAMN06265222_10794 [Neorhodopirellula lusitana]|uniref:PIN domain-containing protein n=1 Tax=Neorhodopirellula lusitana TaxID=445327 RepID=A0ABY1QAV0_9BACT|nr:hypothetical protein [Neorhodopirellula lusitana]SMP61401.1 hypothetical protein SAMN06265222_10794 [Neorhodopirellula lusitana]